MTVGLIWAQSTSGVIGRDGTIPWHLPEDLARFKKVTMGHTVVMGRRTWESLPARFRPLPHRRNIVLTRNRDFEAPGAEVFGSIDDAIDDQTWVIGGSEIYHLALPAATRCEVTEVEIDLRLEDDDALAPVLDESWIGTSGDTTAPRVCATDSTASCAHETQRRPGPPGRGGRSGFR
jgi:dihydrofolate reductase